MIGQRCVRVLLAGPPVPDVCLDARKVAYLPPSEQCQTVHIRTHENAQAPAHGGKAGKTFSQYPFAKAMLEVLNG